VVSGDFGYSGCGFPATFAPGTSCTFSITFSPLSAAALAGAITIASNAPGSPHAIALSGTGAGGPQPALRLTPQALDFGTLRLSNSASQQVRLSSTGSAPLTISSIALTGASFNTSNDCAATLAIGSSCTITITFAPTQAGTQRGEVAVRTDTDPPLTTVPLVGEAVELPPAVLAVNGFVDFGQHVIGSTTRQSLDLLNVGEQPLVIAGIELNGAAFHLEGDCGTIAPAGRCTLGLTFTPGDVATYAGRVTIASNDARGTVSVDLLGQGIAVPKSAVDVEPQGIGFSNQMITTQSTSQPVTILSTGSAPLNISAVLVDGPFVLAGNNCPATLAPGAQCDVSVAFVPSAAGFGEGRISVVSDAASGRDFASLTGTGCRFFSVAGSRNLQHLCSP